MLRRTLVKLSAVAIVAAQVLTVTSASVGAQTATETYVSPTYGYSLTYDATWEIASQTSESGVDTLELEDGPAFVTIDGGVAYEGDPGACVEDLAEQRILTGPGYSNVTLKMDGADDPTSAYAIYDFTYTFEDGKTAPFTDILQCETLVSGESVVAFWQTTPAAAYADHLDAFNAVVAGLSMAEVSATTETVPTDAVPEEWTYADAVLALGGDLDAFWNAQFASADEYFIRPFYAAVEESVETACDAPLLAEAGAAATGLDAGLSSMYCGLDQTIYLDVRSTQEAIDQVGPAAFVYTLAHEVGHHVQMQLGLSWEAPTVVTELQADCLAGAAVADAVIQGWVMEEEVMALQPLVLSYGDSAEMTADDPFSHGEGTQRWAMFLRGYAMGAAGNPVLAACEM